MWREKQVCHAHAKAALVAAILVFTGVALSVAWAVSPAFGTEAREETVPEAAALAVEGQMSGESGSTVEERTSQPSGSAAGEKTSKSAASAAEEQAPKTAIPAIEKTVSAGGAWAKDIQAEPSSPLFYRLEATMPEDVETWDSLMYRIADEPAEGVTVDWSSVSAHVESKKGALKGNVAAAVTQAGKGVVLTFGDLKKADFDLSFGDMLVVEYTARLDSASSAGAYRNIARLDYLLDGGWVSSVEVDSTVRVPEQVLENPPSQGTGSSFDKTGYLFMRYWPVAAGIGVALVVAGVVLIALGKKRSSRQGVPFNPDAPWMY